MQRSSRRRLRALGLGAAAVALAAAPVAIAAFTSDGTTANATLASAGEPSIVLGGLKGVGNARVPWIALSEPQNVGGPNQVFVQKFAGGVFTLQGASLNFDQQVAASHPSIDFAGKGVTVPWTTWEEPVGPGGNSVAQVFASRFLPNADLANGSWEINGALRASEADSTVPRGPSINIHTDRAGTEPRLAGGTTVAGNDPVPWVVWREQAGPAGLGTQIFVAKGVKDSAPGAAQAGSFTWHPQGTDRGPAGQEAAVGPSLNDEIGATRDAVHPDIAFTGPNSTVPWVVWYEEPAGGAPQVAPENQRVFASKFVPDTAQGDRGGKWIPVGNSTACAFATANEDRDACSLNAVGNANAENPNVTAGSLDPTKPTVPWVAWHEEATPGGIHLIFVSRLVNGDHFVVFPGPNVDGSLNASPAQDADEPDLRFEGNVLHVTWKEVVAGGKVHEFERRFTPGPNGTGNWSTAVDIQIDATLDGGNPAVSSFGGTPFITWAEGPTPPTAGDPVVGSVVLRHDPATAAAQTAAATNVLSTSATLNGAATGDPGVYAVSFDVGPTTAYGQTLQVGDITHNAPDPSQPFSAPLTGLAPGTVVHYRANLTTALGTVNGVDQVLTTTTPVPIGPAPVIPTTPTTTVPVVTPPPKPRLHRVRVRFRLATRGIVRFEVHRRTARGKVVARFRRGFARGRRTFVVPIRATGRFVVVVRFGKRTLVVRSVLLK
ncbi:MAG: hypothetical protein QOK40_2386 [Miltoncostaeaceae bacterium]|nr:hypothetical protein [Miltoncostaeaceae bacterium]